MGCLMFSAGRPLDEPRGSLWNPREEKPREDVLGVKRCQLPALPFPFGRDPCEGVNPRLEPLKPRFGVFPRLPAWPERDSNERTEFPELGGVNVCQPGREEVMEPRFPPLLKPFTRPFAPADPPTGRPLRLALN